MASVKSSAEFGDGAGYAVTVEGLQELRADLMTVEPKLNYKLNSRLRRVGNVVAGEARVLTGRLAEVGPDRKTPGRPSPLAGETSEAVSGIEVKMGGSKSNRDAVVRVIQTSRIGAIVEFAEIGRSPQGEAFVSLLNRRFGDPGRFIWEAADNNRTYVTSEVLAVVAQTEAELNAKLGIGA